MNDLEICKKVLSLREEKSVLKLVREYRGLSIRKLSALSGIKETTLNAYEKDNKNLFGASMNNIIKLKDALGVSTSLLVKESSYIPFTSVLFNNKEFRDIFITNLIEYYSHSPNDKYVVVDSFKEEKEYRSLLKEYKYIVSLFLPSFVGIISTNSNKIIYKILTDIELLQLYKKSVYSLDITYQLTF